MKQPAVSHESRRSEKALAPVWKALGDPTRRLLLDLLREGPRTTGQLAGAFPTTRYAVMQHLSVLVEAGLVVVSRSGRERWNRLNAIPLQQLYERWVRPYEAHWADGLIQFKKHVEASERGGTMTTQELGLTEIELEIAIDAPRARSWAALVEDFGLWWPKDFYAHPASTRIILEPRAGGRLYEESGTGTELLWATVVLFDPPQTLEWVGHLVPAYGGPATDMTRLSLSDAGGTTHLCLSQVLYGRVTDQTGRGLKEGWERIFNTAFKSYVESGKAV